MFTFFRYSVYFLFGVATYRFVLKFIENQNIKRAYLLLVLALFVVYLLIYDLIPFKVPINLLDISDIYYYGIFSIVIPFIFLATKNSKMDAFLGEFSYPVYITHFFIIKLVSNITFLKNRTGISSALVIITTFVVAYLILIFLIRPIDSYRQKRVNTVSTK
jgi:peptidoglycan/LPS O-acetylase OafA/YrhL